MIYLESTCHESAIILAAPLGEPLRKRRDSGASWVTYCEVAIQYRSCTPAAF